MTRQVLLAATSLDNELRSFGSLASLVLALITLYTVQRATALRELATSSSATKSDGRRGLLIDSALTLATGFIFVAGLPLAIDAVDELHFLRVAGGVRSVFLAVWILVGVLIVWQASLVVRGIELLPRLRSTRLG